MPGGDGEVAFGVVGKGATDAVFLHDRIVGLNPHPDVVLAGAHRDDLRQAALQRVGGDDAEFLFRGAGDGAGKGEVVIDPDRELGAAEAVLQLQVQAGVFRGNRGVYRHEESGCQEQSEENPGLEGHTLERLYGVLVGRRGLGAELCDALGVHGNDLLSPGEVRALQLPRCAGPDRDLTRVFQQAVSPELNPRESKILDRAQGLHGICGGGAGCG